MYNSLCHTISSIESFNRFCHVVSFFFWGGGGGWWERGVPVLTYIVKHSSSFSLEWLPVVCEKFKSIQSFFFGGGGG